VIATILTLLAKAFGVVDKVTAMLQAHQQAVAGQNELLAKQNAQAAEQNANVAKAAVSTDDSAAVDLLRDGRA